MTEMSVDIHRIINSNFYKKVGCARKAGIGWKFCVILFLVFELVSNLPNDKNKPYLLQFNGFKSNVIL